MYQQDPPVEKKSPNPLFLVLAVLSAIPTLICGITWVSQASSGGGGAGFLFVCTAWCAMWTVVWWKMADRYR